ncbi:hypothetical protein [Fructobacillus fructosus]|uniref:hypothetical protein n=1 Tax=Fructobacillus fructosus TaxID=1631 RepID=UPI002D90E127|nr:unnamed protein product [Fructobacillus fructosus]CAK1236554.1 unnamed protein product [Fructobacillus fructosus]CAK1237842.1 unnamed protein product [Fructobacillus fructosus]
MLWYFKYNPQTFELVSGAVCADEQPENSTTIDPAGTPYPVFNVAKQAWESDTVKISELEERQKHQTQTPDVQKQIADLYARVLNQELKGL